MGTESRTPIYDKVTEDWAVSNNPMPMLTAFVNMECNLNELVSTINQIQGLTDNASVLGVCRAALVKVKSRS